VFLGSGGFCWVGDCVSCVVCRCGGKGWLVVRGEDLSAGAFGSFFCLLGGYRGVFGGWGLEVGWGVGCYV